MNDSYGKTSIAVLLTCFNRREMTLICLKNLYNQVGIDAVGLHVFLVDDGSSDGTSKAVAEAYPDVRIIAGSGSLFWAGGMRLAWKTAMETGRFDFFWLVNDDTHLHENALKQLLDADAYALNVFGKRGIYTGSTCDPETKRFTYGGHRLTREKDYIHQPVVPNGNYQTCDFCNANSLLVSEAVCASLGNLSARYTHVLADFDYSFRAREAGFPVLVLPAYVGECRNDHLAFKASKATLKQRINYLYSAKGFAYKEFLVFTRTFFPSTYIRTIVSFWIMTLFPRLWSAYKRKKVNSK